MADSTVAGITGAVAALSAVGLGQWLTYAREEAARLRREKKEAAAQALAAWRDYETAIATAKEAREDWSFANRQYEDALKHYGDRLRGAWAADQAESEASAEDRESAKEVRERADRALARIRPDYTANDARLRDLATRSDASKLAQANAERHVNYCRAMLEMACAPAVVNAYDMLTSAWTIPALKGHEWKLRDTFTLAVRRDVELVTVCSCLWSGTAQLPWARAAAVLPPGTATALGETKTSPNDHSEASP